MKKITRLICCIGVYLFVGLSLPCAYATQFCDNVVVGMAPAQGGNGQVPIYENQCRWVAGAVAFDPHTRSYYSSWNYDNADGALERAISGCGMHCVAFSFFEDFAYVAISQDDNFYGYSTQSARDAINRCESESVKVKCDAVIGASSTTEAIYWVFGAIAYDKESGQVGSSKNYLRLSDAVAAAKATCGMETCVAYGFQGGYGAMAMSTEGKLFGAWSSEDGYFINASKDAKRNCKKATGDKNCKIVVKGNAGS